MPFTIAKLIVQNISYYDAQISTLKKGISVGITWDHQLAVVQLKKNND